MEKSVKALYNAMLKTNTLHIHGYLLISAPMCCTPEYIDNQITLLILVVVLLIVVVLNLK